MSQEAYDFLELERAEISRRIASAKRTRTARRVSHTTLPAEAVEVTSIFMGTPLGRARLERQNAMAALVPRVATQDFFLQKAEAPADWECAICLADDDSETVIHPRNCHMFHRACLNRWMNVKQYCPMCKAAYNLWFI